METKHAVDLTPKTLRLICRHRGRKRRGYSISISEKVTSKASKTNFYRIYGKNSTILERDEDNDNTQKITESEPFSFLITEDLKDRLE